MLKKSPIGVGEARASSPPSRAEPKAERGETFFFGFLSPAPLHLLYHWHSFYVTNSGIPSHCRALIPPRSKVGAGQAEDSLEARSKAREEGIPFDCSELEQSKDSRPATPVEMYSPSCQRDLHPSILSPKVELVP